MKKLAFVTVLSMTLFMASMSAPVRSATDPTFVAMAGMVNAYGSEMAYGWLGAFAKVGEWAKVGIFWTFFEPHMLMPPFNYSFYAARLVNTETVELDYMGRDFYVSGLWDVYNITLIYNASARPIFTNMTLVMDDGFGELNVINNWAAFTANIDGIEQVAGLILWHCTRSFEIPQGDLNWDGTVDIYDLVHVAKAYEDTPGVGNYYFDIDFNFDLVVDIYDLTTLAANLGESY